MPGMDGLALVESVLGEGCVRRGVVVLTNRWDHGEIRDRLAGSGRARAAETVQPQPAVGAGRCSNRRHDAAAARSSGIARAGERSCT